MTLPMALIDSTSHVAGGFVLFAFMSLLLAAVYALPWLMVFSKAGYPTWYGLVAVIPGINIVALIVFAIVEWPMEREMREYKERLGLIEQEPEPDTEPDVG